eukprot:2034169-Rhodomonas_salina.1
MEMEEEEAEEPRARERGGGTRRRRTSTSSLASVSEDEELKLESDHDCEHGAMREEEMDREDARLMHPRPKLQEEDGEMGVEETKKKIQVEPAKVLGNQGSEQGRLLAAASLTPTQTLAPHGVESPFPQAHPQDDDDPTWMDPGLSVMQRIATASPS